MRKLCEFMLRARNDGTFEELRGLGIWNVGVLFNWLARVQPKPSPKCDPLPCAVEVQMSDDRLTLLNYDGGTASELVIAVDGEPWDCGLESLEGGRMTQPMQLPAGAASVVVRWVDEFGTAGEWPTLLESLG